MEPDKSSPKAQSNSAIAKAFREKEKHKAEGTFVSSSGLNRSRASTATGKVQGPENAGEQSKGVRVDKDPKFEALRALYRSNAESRRDVGKRSFIPPEDETGEVSDQYQSQETEASRPLPEPPEPIENPAQGILTTNPLYGRYVRNSPREQGSSYDKEVREDRWKVRRQVTDLFKGMKEREGATELQKDQERDQEK